MAYSGSSLATQSNDGGRSYGKYTNELHCDFANKKGMKENLSFSIDTVRLL